MKVLNFKDVNFLKSKITQIHYLYGLFWYFVNINGTIKL